MISQFEHQYIHYNLLLIIVQTFICFFFIVTQFEFDTADKVKDLSELPNWSFDGSSTGQAEGHDSEVLLRPVKYVPDPFRLSNNILVLLSSFCCGCGC